MRFPSETIGQLLASLRSLGSCYSRLVGYTATALVLSACGGNDSGLLTSSAQANLGTAAEPASVATPQQATTTPNQFSANAVLPEGLVLHLEADVGVTEYQQQVTDWEDQSPAKNSLTSIGAPRLVRGELNELPVIEFNGIDSQLVRETDLHLPEGNSDRTVMLLIDYQGGEGGVSYGTPQCNSAFQTVTTNEGYAAIQGSCGSNEVTTTSDIADDGWVIQTAILKDSELAQYNNVELVKSSAHQFNTVAGELVVGGTVSNTGFTKMQVAAVLIWNTALQPEDFQSALTYLQSKYFDLPPTDVPAPSQAVAEPINERESGEIIDPIVPKPDPERYDLLRPDTRRIGGAEPEIGPAPISTPATQRAPSVPPAPIAKPDLPAAAPVAAPERPVAPSKPAEPAVPPAQPVTTSVQPIPPAQPEPAPPPRASVEAPGVRMWTSNTNEGVVQLNWEASNAESCEASGAWRGTKAASGMQRFTGRDIGDTFRINCSGAGGVALGMVTLVDKAVRLTWRAPDNTPEGAISYGIHYGTSTGSYSNTVNVDSQRASQLINVTKGPLHLAMTTTNAAGQTSAYSNELVVTID